MVLDFFIQYFFIKEKIWSWGLGHEKPQESNGKDYIDQQATIFSA
jgi:hypothetical protein